MRFLVDECIGPSVARWLRETGHDAVSVHQTLRGLPDEEVLRSAASEERILITTDKDFGEQVFRLGERHRGVILLRLDDERSLSIRTVLADLLANYPNELSNRFVVVTEQSVRFARQRDG